MSVSVFSYKISFDTRPLGRKGTLHMKFGSGPDVVIPNLDAAQTAAVAAILGSSESPSYDPGSQTVSSIRVIRSLDNHRSDIAALIPNLVIESPFDFPNENIDEKADSSKKKGDDKEK